MKHWWKALALAVLLLWGGPVVELFVELLMEPVQ